MCTYSLRTRLSTWPMARARWYRQPNNASNFGVLTHIDETWCVNSLCIKYTVCWVWLRSEEYLLTKHVWMNLPLFSENFRNQGMAHVSHGENIPLLPILGAFVPKWLNPDIAFTTWYIDPGLKLIPYSSTWGAKHKQWVQYVLHGQFTFMLN